MFYLNRTRAFAFSLTAQHKCGKTAYSRLAGKKYTYVDEGHVRIGDMIHPCSGPRIHVSSTGKIGDLQLLYRFVHDKRKNRYLLVGCIGEKNLEYIRKMNPGQL